MHLKFPASFSSAESLNTRGISIMRWVTYVNTKCQVRITCFKTLKVDLTWNDYCRHSAWSFLEFFLCKSVSFNSCQPQFPSISWKLFWSFIVIHYNWKSKESKFWICYSFNRAVCNCTRCHHSVGYLVLRLSANSSSHNGDIQTLRNNAVLARNGL